MSGPVLMSMIDPTARIEDGAVIGEGATIGPYCIIGRNVVIGANCNLIAHVHVTAQTTIGAGCTIYPFVSLGTPPQSLSYKGELTRLEIGAGCTIRESVTMNAGTVAGGGVTRVGERGYFMNCSHVGHDCHVGDARRSLRDRRFRLHRRAVGGAPVHPDRAAGDGRRRLRRARRYHSIRARQRSVCEPRRVDH